MTHTIEFDPNIERELTRLAALAGKDTEQFIKDAVLEYLHDLKDIADAEAILQRIERGDENVIPLDELERRLDALDG
ncbi:type II toxin-antitoxin system RelB family antitoxin [Candidatus Methylocalor cossyra]|uniref:CopG family transcriptional regulator n=1 Tax=Candidatus Methylocalor cossyra TaxID=3108543 RepID=A0ABM9NMS4_9GAMM